MKRSLFSKIAFVIGLLVAIGFLVYGNLRSHKVYDPETEKFGIETFDWINERQLVEDATFSGTIREKGKLYSTYDRSQPVGKRACPT